MGETSIYCVSILFFVHVSLLLTIVIRNNSNNNGSEQKTNMHAQIQFAHEQHNVLRILQGCTRREAAAAAGVNGFLSIDSYMGTPPPQMNFL